MTDESSTAGNSPFSVVDNPFPDLFANLTDRVGPIRFATVTDSGLLVTVEIPVEVDGFDVTSTLGPEAVFDVSTVVLRTTFEPSGDGDPVFELVGPSIDPGFDALRFWESSASDLNVSPDAGVPVSQLSTGAVTALETDLVPGVTILTSDPDLVIELFMEPPSGLLPLADLGPDVPFAGIRMITEAVASLLPAGPSDLPMSTATSTMGFVPGFEPDTPDDTDLPTSSPTSTHGMDLGPDATYLVVTNSDPTGAPTDDFTLDITPEPDDTDLPTSTATSTMGGAVGDNGYPPPRRSGIRLVLIGGIILATLSGAAVWAVSQSGGGEVAVDGGAGQILVDPDSVPLDPPPSSLIPASSTSSTSSTTSAPSSSSTSSTSTSSTSSTSTSSTSSTSTSSTTSVVPPPTSSDAPPASSTSSTTTSKKPPASTTTSTTSSTTTPIIVPPSTTPLPTSKSATASIICSGSQFDTYSSYIDIYIPTSALAPRHSFPDAFVCAAASVKVSSEIIPVNGSGTPPFPPPQTPPAGKQTYRVMLVASGARTNVDVFDGVKVLVNWANP